MSSRVSKSQIENKVSGVARIIAESKPFSIYASMWFAYESGRGHIFAKSAGGGRAELFSGTARECYIFINGILTGYRVG